MSLFARLGWFTYRRRWPILLFWAVMLVTAALFAPKLGGQLKGGGLMAQAATPSGCKT